MPRITIFSSARRELIERMKRFAVVAAVLIMGPMLHDPRAPATLEDAWLLERLYGPAQRWVIDVVPARSLERIPVEAGETLYVQDVDGLRVAVLTSKTVSHLAVELWDGALRVYEVDT